MGRLLAAPTALHETPPAERGFTLLETVLATAVAAIFLAAFMGLFDVEQANFRAAQDEAALPAEGHALLGAIFGQDGFLTCDSSAHGAAPNNVPQITPGQVSLWDVALGQTREIAFYPDPNTPTGPQTHSGVGTLTLSVNGSATTSLAPADAVATMSFYSPDLVSVQINGSWYSGGQLVSWPMTVLPGGVSAGTGVVATVGTTANMAPGQTLAIDTDTSSELVVVKTVDNATTFTANFAVSHGAANTPVGLPAFYILGATAAPTDGLGNTYNLTYSRSASGVWTFEYPSPTQVEQTTFAPGAVFTIDGESAQAGELICAFPATEATVAGVSGTVPVKLAGPPMSFKRIGVWLQMNSGPTSGLEILRDELSLLEP